MADYALIVVGALLALGVVATAVVLLLTCLCGKRRVKDEADAADADTGTAGADAVEGAGVSGAGGAA